MVRITSGQRSDPNEALLQGMEIGRGFKQAQLARQQQQDEQMNRALRMQEIQMRFENARAKREQALAQAAQMGDAKAIQTLAFEHQLKPSEQMLQAALKMRQGITDPKALAEADAAIAPMIKATQHQEQLTAAEEAIQRSLSEGLIASNVAQSARDNLKAGGNPAVVLKGIATLERKRAEDQINTENTAKFIEQSRARLETMPPAARREAEIKIAEIEQSPGKQSKPDTGAQLLGDVEGIANKVRNEQIAAYVKQRTAKDFAEKLQQRLKETKDKFGEQILPTGKGYGQNVFPSDEPFEQPRTQGMQAHITKQKAEKEKRYPGSTEKRPFVGPLPAEKDPNARKPLKEQKATVRSTALDPKQIQSEDDVVDSLIAQGIELTEGNVSEALKEWRARGR